MFDYKMLNMKIYKRSFKISEFLLFLFYCKNKENFKMFYIYFLFFVIFKNVLKNNDI